MQWYSAVFFLFFHKVFPGTPASLTTSRSCARPKRKIRKSWFHTSCLPPRWVFFASTFFSKHPCPPSFFPYNVGWWIFFGNSSVERLVQHVLLARTTHRSTFWAIEPKSLGFLWIWDSRRIGVNLTTMKISKRLFGVHAWNSRIISKLDLLFKMMYCFGHCATVLIIT